MSVGMLSTTYASGSSAGGLQQKLSGESCLNEFRAFSEFELSAVIHVHRGDFRLIDAVSCNLILLAMARLLRLSMGTTLGLSKQNLGST